MFSPRALHTTSRKTETEKVCVSFRGTHEILQANSRGTGDFSVVEAVSEVENPSSSFAHNHIGAYSVAWLRVGVRRWRLRCRMPLRFEIISSEICETTFVDGPRGKPEEYSHVSGNRLAALFSGFGGGGKTRPRTEIRSLP